MFNVWDQERAAHRNQRRVRYIYRIDQDQPSRVRKRFKLSFAAYRLSRLFYLTLSYAQFRRLSSTASGLEGS